jgi:hypothetical protein
MSGLFILSRMEVGYMEQVALNYKVESKTVIFQGKPITLTNRTPIFTPEQREKQRLFIEQRLYPIAKKYSKNAC